MNEGQANLEKRDVLGTSDGDLEQKTNSKCRFKISFTETPGYLQMSIQNGHPNPVNVHFAGRMRPEAELLKDRMENNGYFADALYTSLMSISPVHLETYQELRELLLSATLPECPIEAIKDYLAEDALPELRERQQRA